MPFSNHLVWDRILAPSASHIARDEREHSRFCISKDFEPLPQAEFFLPEQMLSQWSSNASCRFTLTKTLPLTTISNNNSQIIPLHPSWLKITKALLLVRNELRQFMFKNCITWKRWLELTNTTTSTSTINRRKGQSYKIMIWKTTRKNLRTINTTLQWVRN